MRSYALTIAGFDPSSGAGLTADIKTFEQHKVYGLSVCSAITLQTEDAFHSIRWENLEDVLESLDVLLNKYNVSVVKTGILPSLDYLSEIVSFLKLNFPAIKIIVDPILTSSTGFDFMESANKELYYSVLKSCFLITPNIEEVLKITGKKDGIEAAKEISEHCNIFLKGGHSDLKLGVDYLFSDSKIIEFLPTTTEGTSKHGSGCILSAAIVANLALGLSLEESCRLSKKYIESILTSNQSLLAYHYVS